MYRSVRTLVITISLLSSSYCLSAQQSVADSLTHLLSTHQEEDTVKLNLLIGLARHYVEMGSDQGLKFGKQAILLSEQLGQEKQKALAYYYVAFGYDYSGEYEWALESYQTASSLLESLQMNLELVYCYSSMSRLYRNKGDYDQAMLHIKKARDINEAREDLVNLSDNLDKIGTLASEMGQMDNAMDYYQQALALREQLNDSLAIAKTMLNIASVFQAKGRDDDALDYAYKALRNFESAKDTLYMAGALSSIGYIRMQYDDIDLAREHLNRSLLLFKAIDNKIMVVKGLTTLAYTYIIDDDYKQAILYYEEALKIAEDFNFEADAATIVQYMSACYAELEQYDLALQYAKRALHAHEALDNTREVVATLNSVADVLVLMKTYDQAISYVDKALTLLESDNRLMLKISLNETAFMAHEGAGNYKKAYEYLSTYMALNDSLNSVETRTEIANLISVHDLKEQESENEVLRLNQELDEATIKRQNNLIIGTILVIVVLVVFTFIVYRGLLQRRRMSADLSRLNEQLKTLNDYRTRLFANINHDFRTPLTLIKGYADQIVGNGDNYLTGASEGDLKNLRHNTLLLTQMTTEIQNLLLLEEGKLELSWNEIQLLPTLRVIVNMFDSKMVQQKKKLSLTAEIEEDLVFHADQLHFKKMLFNLISNAIKHTSEGDSISVTLSLLNGQVNVQVSDTGEGIDADHLPHIFDRFYQAPGRDYKSVEGFGIGLALVKELTELHGGSINAESEPGKGTTFTLLLPLNLDKPTVAPKEEAAIIPPVQAVPVKKPAAGEATSDKKYRLLVVDDHDEIRHYISGVLEKAYTVRQAAHGREALEILENEKVDLIITDLMMPWLDGFELIEEVRQSEKWQHIPVMVVSARTTEQDKMKVLDAGVNDFIAKPFDLDELTKKVENHIGALDTARKNIWQAVAENKNLKSNLEQNILKKINQLIIERIEDPQLKVEDIAEEICASQRKTFNLLKSLTGQSPGVYIKNIRLDYVHQLIVSGKLVNATEAARAIGMKNGTEFKKQYINKFGVEPFPGVSAGAENS
ncbi:MAG: response regulator [Roseivirga sp.]|nr:response regulator [Roseivirga sp.]